MNHEMTTERIAELKSLGIIANECREEIERLKSQNETFRNAQKSCEDCDAPTIKEYKELKSKLDAIAAECKLHPKAMWMVYKEPVDCDCQECQLKRRIMAILGSDFEKRYVTVDDLSAACNEMNRKAHWVHSLVAPTLSSLDDIWYNGKIFGGAGEAYVKCIENQRIAKDAAALLREALGVLSISARPAVKDAPDANGTPAQGGLKAS